MKKEITLGQAITLCVTILITCITGWITMNNKMSRLEAKDLQHDATEFEMKLNVEKKFNKIDDKTDEIQTTLTDIKVLLERKVDRK